MEIDPRFFTVHPRTALWWVQRDQCRRCKHHEHAKGGGEQCKVSPSSAGRTNAHPLCITSRDEGQPCGPDAALFEAVEVVA